MADLRYAQEVRIGGQDVHIDRKEVVIDWSWNRFKTIMVVIGGVLVFWTVGFTMYACGRNSNPVVAVEKPTAPPAATATTVPEIEKLLASAIAKMAEAKPARTAEAEATVKTAPPPQTIVVKVVQPPPPAPPSAPAAQAPAADPMAGKTPKERCDYEIIRLRRPTCSEQ